MKIGLFTDTYPPYINGVSTSVHMLKMYLEKMGHEVYIITTNNRSALKYYYDEENKILRVPGVPIGIYDYRLSGVYPATAVKKIKEWNLDVIHSHTEFSIGIMARMIGRECHIPLVHTYHTLYEDYVYYVTHGYFDKITKKLLEYITNFYCDTTADELIVPTEKIYRLFIDKYKFQKDINIIPTGIDTDRFKKEYIEQNIVKELEKKYKITKKDFVIIAVGRVAVEKNFDLLIKSMPNLIKENQNIKLMIVGDGPYKKDLEEQVENLKIKNNVIFVGKVPWDDMPYYYSLGNIYSSASTSETQGLTVIEAMSGGLVPLCIEDEAFTSMITNNLNGFIFKDEKGFQNKVLELSKSREKLLKVQKKAIEKSDEFSARIYAEKVSKVYERAIKEKEEDTRFGIFSVIYNKLKGVKNDNTK